MKFGAPSNLDDLDQIDFTLPPDHPSNTLVLSKTEKPNVYVGCSVWAEDAWVGDLYPEGTKKKDYQAEYIKRMSCIELNSTFYNAKKVVFQKLADAAQGHDFKICPKYNRQVSHFKRISEESYEFVDYFVDMCLTFGDNLGMPFIQMPENFAPKWFERVQTFVERLPMDFSTAIELRHPEWYQGEVFNELFQMLQENNKVAVITDTATKREIIHQRLTTDKAFIRFAAYEQHPSNLKRMDAWAERLSEWVKLGVKEVYFFSKQEDETYAPRQAEYMIQKLNQLTDLKLKSPYTA